MFHAGDGNLHPLICYDEKIRGQSELAAEVGAEILQYCIDAGGSLTGEHGTLTPSHTGAQPALYELEGKTVRPLGRETDKAFALVNALDEAQRKQAVLGIQMHDLVLGPGRDGQTIQPEGIRGSALTEKQREMLLAQNKETELAEVEQREILRIDSIVSQLLGFAGSPKRRAADGQGR